MLQLPFHILTSMHGIEEAQGDPLFRSRLANTLFWASVCRQDRWESTVAVVASQGAVEFQA